MKKQILRFLILMVIAIFTVAISNAQITLINIPGDYLTIQEGINAAVNGDTVLVHPGGSPYVEDINFIGKSITVASLFLTTQDTSYISQTVIGGNVGLSNIVTFNNGEDSTSILTGFTITSYNSNGIYCDFSSPTISYNTISNNDYYGIYCNSSSPTISNNTINNNDKVGIGCFNTSSPSISNNFINNNVWYGICCYNTSSPSISNNIISNHFKNGICCYNTSSPIISNNIIEYNVGIFATHGGIRCEDSSSPTISYNTICNNYNGILCGPTSPVISYNTISNNAGYGISCNLSSPAISHNTISNNDGGGMSCMHSSSAISYNTISNNGDYGIHIAFDDSYPAIINNTISSNNNGGILFTQASSPTILNNIIYDHFIGITSYDSSPLSLEYNLFWLNDNDCSGDSIPASFGGITTVNANGDSCDVYYNLFMHPFFVDPDNNNYHIAEVSPCIDAGNPNPVYNDPDGSIGDIGAFHYDAALVSLTADFSASPVYGNLTLGVQFTNLSFGFPTTYEWDFQNDGIIDSYVQDPSFTYTEPGFYTVSLTAFDASASTDVKIRQDYIAVYADHIGPLITNDNWRSYQWPYNAYYPLTSNPNHRHGVVNGHVAASCGPAAVSRILHYWEFPVQGNGSFSYTDVYGCQYSADFGNTIYEWDNMPFMLNESDPESVYGPTATLFYHVATSVNDVNVTGGSPEMWITGLTSYFCYSSTAQNVLRSNYTRDEWINIYKNEIAHGRPIFMGGDNTSGGGHWFICDGYNESDEFHFLMIWGGAGDGYYDIDNPNGYSVSMHAVIGLEPDLYGKELDLISPNEGETILANADTTITWYSDNINNLKIEYTIDNGVNWQDVIASTPASTGTYTWTVPDTASDQCKVKITDVTDVNVYDKSDDVFSIATYGLTLISPNGGEYYFPASSVSITWATTMTSDIKIEYTTDNGTCWNEITDSTSAATISYDWIIPDSISNQCKVKITDITDGAIYDESDNTFEIIEGTSYALQFDGTDDYAIVSNFNYPATDLTLEAWIKPDQFDVTREVIYGINPVNYSTIQFRLESDGRLLYGESPDWTYVSTPAPCIELNEWNHIAMVRENGLCKLYVNGVQLAADTVNEGVDPTEINIGGRVYNMTRFYSGDIDEVRIWAIARTQSEIQDNMTCYLEGTETGLIAYWQMNEDTGQIAFDLSGSGYDLQLGSTLQTDTSDPDWIISTAPIPYYTISDGNWESNSIWATGQNAPEHPWSHVRIKHNITVNSTFEVIELKVDFSGTLTITTGYQVTVSGE